MAQADLDSAQNFNGDFEDEMEVDDLHFFYQAKYEAVFDSFKKLISGDKSARKDINKANEDIRTQNDHCNIEDIDQGVIAIQEILTMNRALISLQQTIVANPGDAMAKAKYKQDSQALVDFNQSRGYPSKWIPEESSEFLAILNSGGPLDDNTGTGDLGRFYVQAKDHVLALATDSKNPAALSGLSKINEEIKKLNQSGSGTIDVQGLITWIEKVKTANPPELNETIDSFKEWLKIQGYPLYWMLEFLPGPKLNSGGRSDAKTDTLEGLHLQARGHVLALHSDSKDPAALSGLSDINGKIKKLNESGGGTTTATPINVGDLTGWIEKLKAAKSPKEKHENTESFKQWLDSQGYPLDWMPEAGDPANASPAKPGEFPWECGLTSGGQRIVAGWKGAGRAVVEELRGNHVIYSIKDQADCGYAQFQKYLSTEGILLINGEQQKVWKAADRDGYEDFLWSATAEYRGGKLCPWNVSCIQWRGGKHVLVRSNLHRLLGARRGDQEIQKYSDKVGIPTPWDLKQPGKKLGRQSEVIGRKERSHQVRSTTQLPTAVHDDGLHGRVADMEQDLADFKKEVQSMSNLLRKLNDSLEASGVMG